MKNNKALYHLPGLFEFFDFYKVFIPLYFEHREFFYDWCDIGSIYGALPDSIWGGGRVGYGQNHNEEDVFAFFNKFKIPVRFAFSNSLLREEHLSDVKCNKLCSLFHDENNGIIVTSDILLKYIHEKYPEFYFISSTTKVLTTFQELKNELNRSEFKYVVPDFRLNKDFDLLDKLSFEEKNKIEFLCNECCWFECKKRKQCYENVSRRVLGEDVEDWECSSPDSFEGYVFSKAMHNPGFISVNQIQDIYLPMGFTNFKIEGRSLGSALLLEFILYYIVKPEYQLNVREKIYLSNSLDLF